MKKILLSVALIATSFTAFAQVGVGTTTPNATLDVVGDAATAAALDGIIAPRLTGDQLRAKTYTAAQTGAMVYVTTADTAPAGQTVNVTATGYYQYNGTVWQQFASGTAGSSKWTNDNANTRVALTNLSDGTTARAAGTEFVITDAGNTGVGTNNPAVKLDVNGYLKLGSTDAAGDAAPVNGMLRYNTATSKFQAYINSAWVDLN